MTSPAVSARKEALLLVVCLALGAFVLPVAVYIVGRAMFGEFGGGGLMDFYGSVQFSIWTLDPVVWFLVLSPYLVLQALRITLRIYRHLNP